MEQIKQTISRHLLSAGSQESALLHSFGFPVCTYVKLLFLHDTHAQDKRDARERWGVIYYLNLTGIKKFKGKWILVLVVIGHRQANGRLNKAQDKVGYFYHLTKKKSLPLVLRVAEKVVWEDLSLEYQYESVENNQATKLDIFYN